MSDHYFTLPDTQLGGPSFKGLAELVAEMSAKKDVSAASAGTLVHQNYGINNFEIQNLVDAFGFNNMVTIARKGLIETLSAEAMPYGVPLDQVQALSAPIVLGAEFADDIVKAAGETGATDIEFAQALHRGAFDISDNTIKGRNHSDATWRKDVSGVVPAGAQGNYEWPYAIKTNMINWTDLSSLTNAKNIRFNNDNSATDLSAVIALVAAEAANSHDKKRDIKSQNILGDNLYASGSAENATANVLREKVYLDLLNLCVPAPNGKEVWGSRQNLGSSSSGGGIAVYLKNGKFIDTFGKNKTYLTTVASFKTMIDGKLSFPVGEDIADKWNEFRTFKAYGFSGSDVASAAGYAADLSGLGATAAQGAGVREAFAAVFGSTGGLEDQLTDYGALETFQNRDGIKLADVSASHDATSLTGLVDKFDAFIEASKDRHWSTTGMVEPTVYSGSKKEVWDKFQTQLGRDPLLSVRNVGAISPEQERRLRVFLEMHAAILTDDTQTAPGNANMQGLGNVGTVGAYASNNLVVGISGGIVGQGNEGALAAVTAVKYVDGIPQPTAAAKEVSLINHANLKSWETTGVLGNASDFTGLFTIDAAYNLRSRIPGLDLMATNMTNADLDNLLKDSVVATRTRNRKNGRTHYFAPSSTAASPITTVTGVTSHLHAGDFFTPGQFQKSFINTDNLQQAANVALRYFNVRDQRADVITDTANSASFGYVTSTTTGGRTVFPAVLRDLKKKGAAKDPIAEAQNTTYAQNVQEMRYVYDGLVRAHLPDEKSAIAEILSWKPVPPQLYVDPNDHTDYESSTDRLAKAVAAKNFNYAAADAAYDNRNLDKQMAHVLTNYFLDASYMATTAGATGGAKRTSVANAHSIMALLDVEPKETLKALEGFGKGLTTATPSPTGLLTYNSAPGALTGVARDTIVYVLGACVQYGKSVSLFQKIASAVNGSETDADLIIDSYIQELNDYFADAASGSEVTFGDSNSTAYITNQHLNYWLPYLSVLTPAQIADRVKKEEGLLTISNDSQVKLLGLLNAACKGKVGSSVSADAPARIAGLNAMFAAGVPKAFIDIAFTIRGVNGYTNFAGSMYESSVDNFA